MDIDKHYSVEPEAPNYWCIPEQRWFFQQAFSEAATIEPPRIIGGPFAPDFVNILKHHDNRLKQVGPELTPDFLVPPTYQSRDTRSRIALIDPEDHLAIRRIRSDKYRSLVQYAQDSSSEVLANQNLDCLDEPPVAHMNEHWSNGSRACFNACFRMVFESVTHKKPSEKIVAELAKVAFGSEIANDYDYLNIFKTQTFKRTFGAQVSYARLLGADFDKIKTVTEKIKNTVPHARLLGVVALSSETTDPDILHTNVVVSAQGGNINTLDPSGLYKSARYHNTMPISHDPERQKLGFAERWAVALNRTNLIIVS